MSQSDMFELPTEKIEYYLLKPGTEHYKEFVDAGYSVNDVDQLKHDIASNFDISTATDFRSMHNRAIHFSIFMDLGKNKEKKRFRTVWRKDSPDSIPRFITAYRA